MQSEVIRKIVFPAQAGVILIMRPVRPFPSCIPRASGGDPL